MKKWLVGLLVLLALIVFVSPGIVGLLAERGLRQAVDETGPERGDIAVTIERFDREWFTSAGRHRVELRSGDLYTALAGIAQEAGHEVVPALIINTDLQHGIWPLAATSDGSTSLMPALARSVSTMQLETGAGELIDIPGTLHSEVSLAGNTRSRYLLEAGDFRSDDVHGQWDGADLLFTVPAAGSSIAVSGNIAAWSLEGRASALQVGETDVDADMTATQYGLDVGSIRLMAERLSFNDAIGTLQFEGLALLGASDIDDGRWSGEASLLLDRLVLPGLDDLAIDLQVSANGIDAASLRTVVAAINAADASSDPLVAMGGDNSALQSDLQMLSTRGAKIRIDRFNLSMPQGALEGSVSLELPQSDSDQRKSWAGLMLLLSASAAIRVDDGLLRFAQSTTPELASLIALGYLRRDGNAYKLDAEVANGILTINGAPISIPVLNQ